jgi:glutamine amidotransferase
VNYGSGNLLAFRNIYSRLNIPVQVASTRHDLSRAEKLILPGVGAFDWAMTRLNESGLRERLDELVLDRKVPVLGVCVGMQMMAKSSEEGELLGLNWIPGDVRKLDESIFKTKTRLPHMGWNEAAPKSHPLFSDIENPQFYFLHSYCFNSESTENILAVTEYGTRFPSAVYRNNIYGVQFHPEKSHHWGIQLLRNFAFI